MGVNFFQTHTTTAHNRRQRQIFPLRSATRKSAGVGTESHTQRAIGGAAQLTGFFRRDQDRPVRRQTCHNKL